MYHWQYHEVVDNLGYGIAGIIYNISLDIYDRLTSLWPLYYIEQVIFIEQY